MCVLPRGAKTREVEGEVERAAVLNGAWPPHKTVFVGLYSTGLPMWASRTP
jgi:hypothetical protein